MPEPTGPVVSLNTDTGEGYGVWRIADDEQLLEVVTDANVACGFHAGDPDVLRRTCALAAARGVGIGAQVGYPDLRGFGRRATAVPPASLVNDVLYQVGALDALARAEGSAVTYVKPHGALYHAAGTDPACAEAVVEGAGRLAVLCQGDSLLAAAARAAGLRVVAEAFGDRGYAADGRLVPRGEDGASVTDPDEAGRRAVRMVVDGVVDAVDGTEVPVRVESLCVHSDSPGALAIARAVRAALEAAGVSLASFAG